jgi:DNA replication protein DnaC
MSTQTIVTQLKELGLEGMAESFDATMALPIQKRPSIERAVEKMIESEVCMRDRKLSERLIKAAKLRYNVYIENIACSTERNLTEAQLGELADCSFVRRGENLLITGLTGCGKSYLACALGRQACALGLSTLYLSMNHFADELSKAKLEGTIEKLLQKLGKKRLLIFDDFGLHALTQEARIALLTILEDRYGEKSVIITSQLPLERWYDYIAEPTLADAIMDRLINSSTHIRLEGETMRGRKRKKQD